MKKLLTIILSIIFIVPLTSLLNCKLTNKYKSTNTSTYDYNDVDFQGLDFYLQDDGTYSVAAGNASDLSSIVIPETHYGKPVTRIRSQGFKNCSNLLSLQIPGNLRSIGDEAFDNYSQLQNIYISNLTSWCTISGIWNLTRCGYEEKRNLYLNNTLLSELIIPDGITSINTSAFANYKNIANVTIPNSVINIDYGAFENCTNITSVVIGKNVTFIEDNAFRDCPKLIEIINKSKLKIEKGNTNYGYLGYHALNIKTVGNSDIVNINNYLFYSCNNETVLLGYIGNKTDLVLPTNKNGNYQIYESAFEDCYNLTSVKIGNNANSIGYAAFKNCLNLTNITLGNNIKFFGMFAFGGCNNLTSITFNGTQKQWNAIEKSEYWNDGIPSGCIVSCTDGDFSL